MTKRSIFAKIFLITFALFSGLVILLHASVYFIFPSTYIESQRQTILKKSQALSKSFQGQEEGTIESVIDLYSKTNDIKVSIKDKEKQNALEVKDDLLVNPDSPFDHTIIIILTQLLEYRTKSRRTDFLVAMDQSVLDDTAFTLVRANFSTIIGKGTDVVDRLDSLVKGVVAKDRQVTSGLFVFSFPFVKPFWNITTHEERE